MGTILRVFLASAALAVFASPVMGLTVTVNTTADSFDGSCDATHCSLRDAVYEVNAAGAGEIELPAAIYRLTNTGASEDAGLTGDLDVTASWMSIVGTGGRPVVHGANADRLFEVHNGSSLEVEQVTLRNGSVSGKGGAVYVHANADFSGSDMVFLNNEATSQGGAVYANYSAGAVHVSNSVFRGNLGQQGGAVYTTSTNSVLLSGNRFLENEAISTGGAVFTSGTTSAVLASNTFLQNVSGSMGGAVATESDVSLVIGFSTFDANESSQGGAISVIGSQADVVGSTITQSVSNYGAIYVSADWQDTYVNITNSTIYGNSGTHTGGLYADSLAQFGSYYPYVYMNHVTVAQNTSSSTSVYDGIVNTDGEVVLRNTILDDGCFTAASFLSDDYNLLTANTCFTTQSNDVVTNSAGLNTNGLQQNGGTTKTVALKVSSSAIDAGSCFDTNRAVVRADQRGVLRAGRSGAATGTACDIGAYEYES